MVSTGGLRGNPLVLNVWGSWCAPCRTEAPVQPAASAQYASRGVQFLGINVKNDPAAATAFGRRCVPTRTWTTRAGRPLSRCPATCRPPSSRPRHRQALVEQDRGDEPRSEVADVLEARHHQPASRRGEHDAVAYSYMLPHGARCGIRRRPSRRALARPRLDSFPKEPPTDSLDSASSPASGRTAPGRSVLRPAELHPGADVAEADEDARAASSPVAASPQWSARASVCSRQLYWRLPLLPAAPAPRTRGLAAHEATRRRSTPTALTRSCMPSSGGSMRSSRACTNTTGKAPSEVGARCVSHRRYHRARSM